MGIRTRMAPAVFVSFFHIHQQRHQDQQAYYTPSYIQPRNYLHTHQQESPHTPAITHSSIHVPRESPRQQPIHYQEHQASKYQPQCLHLPQPRLPTDLTRPIKRRRRLQDWLRMRLRPGKTTLSHFKQAATGSFVVCAKRQSRTIISSRSAPSMSQNPFPVCSRSSSSSYPSLPLRIISCRDCGIKFMTLRGILELSRWMLNVHLHSGDE